MNVYSDRRMAYFYDTSEFNRNQKIGKMVSKIDGDIDSWNRLYGAGSARRFTKDVFGAPVAIKKPMQ